MFVENYERKAAQQNVATSVLARNKRSSINGIVPYVVLVASVIAMLMSGAVLSKLNPDSPMAPVPSKMSMTQEHEDDIEIRTLGSKRVS